MYLREETAIPEVCVLMPRQFDDERGCFFESFSEAALKECGIEFNAVQENHIVNIRQGVIRGLHFQNAPFAQAKIVRCIRGTVDDVAVDIRKGSPTYLKWVMVELSEENCKQLYIPKGFAHGVISRSDYSEIEYVVDELYCPKADRSIRYDDAEIGVEWREQFPVLSMKDKNAPRLRDSDYNFEYDKK